jgi:hypothetical protein
MSAFHPEGTQSDRRITTWFRRRSRLHRRQQAPDYLRDCGLTLRVKRPFSTSLVANAGGSEVAACGSRHVRDRTQRGRATCRPCQDVRTTIECTLFLQCLTRRVLILSFYSCLRAQYFSDRRPSFNTLSARQRGSETSSKRRQLPADLIHNRAVDCVFQHCVCLAISAADEPDLFQIVLGLEQVALLGLPHAVI